jgi:hypothetical protein
MRIRTTITPSVVMEVSDSEFKDLKAQGLIHEVVSDEPSTGQPPEEPNTDGDLETPENKED